MVIYRQIFHPMPSPSLSFLRSVAAAAAGAGRRQRAARCFSSSSSSSSSASTPAMGNTPTHILSKMHRNLHLQPNHPLGIIKAAIERHFTSLPPCPHGASAFSMFDTLPPVVTVQQV